MDNDDVSHDNKSLLSLPDEIIEKILDFIDLSRVRICTRLHLIEAKLPVYRSNFAFINGTGCVGNNWRLVVETETMRTLLRRTRVREEEDYFFIYSILFFKRFDWTSNYSQMAKGTWQMTMLMVAAEDEEDSEEEESMEDYGSDDDDDEEEEEEE
ncbi:hypothetical protein PFISCL1PPCAC_18934, partial [Pristionchus fissidentatus]